jgi:hypothetical protein
LLIADKPAVLYYDSGNLGKLDKAFQEAGFKIEQTYSYDGKLMMPHLMNQKKVGLHLFGWDINKLGEIPEYSCDIEVSIMADPALLKPFTQTYTLRLKGTGMSFVESETHKEGCQKQ